MANEHGKAPNAILILTSSGPLKFQVTQCRTRM